MYQRRSGNRLFGAGDHISLVVDLEGHSEQTGDRQDRAEVTRLSVQTFALQAAAVQGKVTQELLLPWE